MEDKSIIQTEKGYIKLLKNTKNYNWEIKLYEGKDTEAFKKLIEDIETLNNIMLSKFSQEE